MKSSSFAEKNIRARLSDEETSTLKGLIWSGGLTQSDIASEFQKRYGKQVSQATVSRIQTGALGIHIPWPDGSIGRLPLSQQRLTDEWSQSAARYASWPAEWQLRIRDIVNEARIAVSMDEIPAVSQEYIAMLSANLLQTSQEELILRHNARREEDRRRATIMDEFDVIVSAGQARTAARIYKGILQENADERERYESPQEPDKPPTDYKKYPWREITVLAPLNPLVKRALATRDPCLIEAICICFHAVGQTKESWKQDSVILAVERMREFLYSYPEVRARLQKEYNVTAVRNSDTSNNEQGEDNAP